MVSTTHLDEIVEEDPSLAGRSFRPAPEQVAAVNADDGAALRRPLDERGGGEVDSEGRVWRRQNVGAAAADDAAMMMVLPCAGPWVGGGGCMQAFQAVSCRLLTRQVDRQPPIPETLTTPSNFVTLILSHFSIVVFLQEALVLHNEAIHVPVQQRQQYWAGSGGSRLAPALNPNDNNTCRYLPKP